MAGYITPEQAERQAAYPRVHCFRGKLITRVARAMGFAAAFENDGTRAFDIGGLAGLCDAEFETLAPAPCPAPWSRVR